MYNMAAHCYAGSSHDENHQHLFEGSVHIFFKYGHRYINLEALSENTV